MSRPCAAAACAAAANCSGVHVRTNFRAVRLLYGPVLIQNSFVYRWISACVPASPDGMREDGLEHVAHVEVVRVPLVVKNIAAGDSRLVEMPDQDALIDRQRLETVGVQLHDRGFVDALEQILAFDRRGARPLRSGAGVEPEHDIDMAATSSRQPSQHQPFSLTPLARGARGRAPSTSAATPMSLSAHPSAPARRARDTSCAAES